MPYFILHLRFIDTYLFSSVQATSLSLMTNKSQVDYMAEFCLKTVTATERERGGLLLILKVYFFNEGSNLVQHQ